MPDERTPTPGTGGIGGTTAGRAAVGAAGGVVGGAIAAGKGKVLEVPGGESLDALKDGAAAVRRWVSDRHNWVRVSWFGAGVVCFAVGAAMLAGRSAGAATATVIPAGKAAKLVSGAMK